MGSNCVVKRGNIDAAMTDKGDGERSLKQWEGDGVKHIKSRGLVPHILGIYSHVGSRG